MQVEKEIQKVAYNDMAKRVTRLIEEALLMALAAGRPVNLKKVVWNMLKGWEQRLQEELKVIEESEVMVSGNPGLGEFRTDRTE